MPETSALVFRKSTYSGPTTQDCVEVADMPAGAAVRDSKHPGLGHLAFSRDQWVALLGEIRRGAL